MSASRVFVDNEARAWVASGADVAGDGSAGVAGWRRRTISASRAHARRAARRALRARGRDEPHLAPLFGPPELPERCAARAGAVTPDRTTLRYEFACAEEPLTAEDVLRLPWQRQGVMLTVRWADGSTARQFFAGTGAAIEVPLLRCTRAPARSGTPPCATSAWASSTSCSASITCCSCSACCSWCRPLDADQDDHGVHGRPQHHARPRDARPGRGAVPAGRCGDRAQHRVPRRRDPARARAAGPRGQGAMGGRSRSACCMGSACRRPDPARPAAGRDPAGALVLQRRRRDRPADVRRDLGPGGAARARRSPGRAGRSRCPRMLLARSPHSGS